MSMRRFRVAEESMLPSLVPGQEFVATDSRSPVNGEVVVFPHPDRDGFFTDIEMCQPRHLRALI